MPDDKDNDVKKGAEAATYNALAAGGSALATGAPPGQAAIITAGTFLGAMIAPAREWFVRRSKKTAAGYAPGLSEAEAAQHLLEAARDERNTSTIAEMYRRIQDALDESVLPTLGRLFRQYVDDTRRVDPYIRSASEFLASLTSEEFEEVKRLFAFLVVAAKSVPTSVMSMNVLEERAGVVRVSYLVDNQGNFAPGEMTMPSAARVFRLMESAHIGFEPRLVGANSVVQLEICLIDRLNDLLNSV